jgi:hypothetical protein
MTLHPSSACVVAVFVIRRRLRVMLTTTTLEERATDTPTINAPFQRKSGSVRDRCRHGRHTDRVQRNDPQQLPTFAAKLARIDLDSDFEEQQHDADVGEELELMPIGNVTGRERRHQQADEHVADHRRQSEPPEEESRTRRCEQHEADLEDGGGACIHRLERARPTLHAPR